MNFKEKLELYTEAEFLELISSLSSKQHCSEEERDSIIEHIVKLSEHTGGTDIIFYPEAGVEDSPQGVLGVIKAWRAANNLPGFKK